MRTANLEDDELVIRDKVLIDITSKLGQTLKALEYIASKEHLPELGSWGAEFVQVAKKALEKT